MNMREIEVISEVVNFQNFSDAAYSLSYSPSVISKYVSSVEKELGVKRFVRGNKSSELTLTPEGRVMLQDIQRMSLAYRHMMEMKKQLTGTGGNVIRIGSLPRFGNRMEQDILAEFLYSNPDAELEQVKMHARDLLTLLQAGKLDAAFVVLSADIPAEVFFKDILDNSDVDIELVSAETEQYIAVSENFLPGIENEACFSDFRDFTFVLPMRETSRDTTAYDSMRMMAKQNGFKLKTTYIDEMDTTVFRLAVKKPLAIAMTSIGFRVDGIKILRLTDWKYPSNLYLMSLSGNRKELLKNLKDIVAAYSDAGNGS